MNGSYGYHMLKMILALVIVLVLFGGGAYLFKFYVLGKFRGMGRFGGANSPIKVLCRSYIEPRKNITIVEVAGEVLVLGVTNNSIECLTKLEDPEAIETVRNAGGRASRSFVDIFQEKLGSKKKKTDKEKS